MASEEAELARITSALGLGSAPESVESLARRTLARHGDLAEGIAHLAPLRELPAGAALLDQPSPAVTITTSGHSAAEIERALRALGPWRKGPFSLTFPGARPLHIDAEWRSDRKWQRLVDLGVSFEHKRVLDVGTGNGYFLFRLRGAGAREVTGLEPSLRSILQYLALAPLFSPEHCSLWPLRLEQVAEGVPSYDVALSMGVIYHSRDPLQHLVQLRRLLRPGGELILESIVVPSETLHFPAEQRYAGMRNVHVLPTTQTLSSWLNEAGFELIRQGESALVTGFEQRSTPWSSGPSLGDFLEPWSGDPDAPERRTIEGHPRPSRAIIWAQRRGEKP